VNLGDIANVNKAQLIGFIQGKAWAIQPEVLESMQRVLAHCEGDIVNLAQLRAALPSGGMDVAGKKAYRVEDGKAIIPVVGPLDKRASFWHMIFGGESTERIQKVIAEALSDPAVSGLVLNIDSPGGSVDGTKELSDFIYASRGRKPIVAYVDGDALSAAYWIASAADKIIAPETARAGSIGVWMSHMDVSKLYEDQGVKKTYVYAGKYKVAGHEAAPLSSEDKEYLQGFVDKYYTLFVEDVARNRGVGVKKVLKDMAEGRIFIGSDALDAGLIDKLGDFNVALKRSGKMSGRADGKSLREVISAWGSAHGAKTGKEDSDEVKSGLRSRREEMELSTEWDEAAYLAEAKEVFGQDFDAHFQNWYFIRKSNKQTVKEGNVMDLNEFKTTYPELYQAAKQEGVEAFKASEEYSGLVAVSNSLNLKVSELEASNKDLEKKNALAEERLVSAAADREMDHILASSSLPDRLHGKVKKQVDFRGFVKEDEKFEEGSESFKAFSTAFEAEVKDWEKDISGGNASSLGTGAGKGDATGDDALIEYGQKVAREVMGKIRSDAK